MFKRWVMALAVAAGTLGVAFTSGEYAAAAGPAKIQVVTTASAGTMLADEAGRSLYLFTKDERNLSNCYGGCAVAWPPLLTDGAPAVMGGLTQSLIGTTKRTDGAMQVTYNGWPLYYWQRDTKPGDTLGQGVGGNWWVVSPNGGPRQTMSTIMAKNSPLGTILTDDSGRSLYMFTRDQANVSNCSGGCANAWPPVQSIGPAKAADGVDLRMLGLIQRDDGSTQVTYNNMPLYYYAPDVKPGDARGQGVAGGTWWVVAPNGKAISTMMSAGATASTPAALPRTGDALSAGSLGLLAVLGSMLLGGGLWLRRRVAVRA